ncbi:hypothetical protein BS47DRAFT_447782 [Hydnum rufescens UP504]|uniref:Uncharacterized protein n=1 Tax=Hydnum rufescens UP504 TaxID=1448309 RepID=A0A9P6DXV1_9AGAM|nr:hypothetical protein BS47DRAFT_447782 [Hydnum rufescens UP504]
MVFQRMFRHGPFNRPIRISATMLSSYRRRCRHLSDVSQGTDHSKMSIPSGNKIWAQLRPAVAIQDTPSTVLVLHPPIKTSIIARLLKDYRTFVFASTGSLFSLARFRTTHEVSGAAQYLRRQDRVLGLSVAFMAEPALSRFIRFRFGVHKRIGGIVDVIGRHATQAEGYAIQSFLEAQELGIVLGFPSADLASEARNALLTNLDPLLATDARFNSTFLDAYPHNLHVHIGPRCITH